MNIFKIVQLVALACAISSAGCALDVDESDHDENIAVTNADLGTFNGSDDDGPDGHDPTSDGLTGLDDQDHEASHASADDARTAGEEEGCLAFETLMDPDPVSWRPAPTGGEDDNGTDKD